MSLAEAEKVISEGKTNQAGKRYIQVRTNPSSPAVSFILHPHPPRSGGSLLKTRKTSLDC
jgi:hypothetical protein